MKIDRQQYPHLSKEELQEFVEGLKEMELKALIEAVEEHGENIAVPTVTQHFNDKVEDQLDDIDESVKEVRKLLSGGKKKST